MKKNKLTYRGVALDLNYSPYFYLVVYRDYHIKFMFSSMLYRDKFAERYEENRKTISASLSNRFGFDIEVNPLSDIKLYTSIEKRGFLIYKGKGNEVWEKINHIEKLKFLGTEIVFKQPTNAN